MGEIGLETSDILEVRDEDHVPAVRIPADVEAHGVLDDAGDFLLQRGERIARRHLLVVRNAVLPSEHGDVPEHGSPLGTCDIAQIMEYLACGAQPSDPTSYIGCMASRRGGG